MVTEPNPKSLSSNRARNVPALEPACFERISIIQCLRFCARWDGDVLNVELWAAVAQAMVSHIVFLCVSKKSVIMLLI